MNYGVARIETRTRESVGKFERHNERKNETYENMNVDLWASDHNVHFKSPGDLTYNEYLDRLIADGKVSLRGLKPDAKVFDELILDVNSGYFEKHGGYQYAVRFYETAFHFAEQLYGRENIISAVMHADEVNKKLSEECGHTVYHYHLHVMALPVVDKAILWTKRCKDPKLVGTVKDVIQQVSHSKKWASDTPMRDENGQPLLQKNGKPRFVASYSILQDRFLSYMQEHGFRDIQRGEKGSTAEHLSVLEYQIAQDKEQLGTLKEKIKQEQAAYKPVHDVHMMLHEVETMGKGTLLGKVQIGKEDYTKLTRLATEGITSRVEIERLREENSRLLSRNYTLRGDVNRLQEYIDWLEEKCRPFLKALQLFPDRCRSFVDEIKALLAEYERKFHPERQNSGTAQQKAKRSDRDWER